MLGAYLSALSAARFDSDADGWRRYGADDELEDEEPELVAFCAECAAREFD